MPTLKHIEVRGLNGRISVNQKLDPEVNIITGLNGSGKTTLLKLMWYIISANIERIPREMSFSYIRLVGENFTFTAECSDGQVDIAARIKKYSTRFRCTLSEMNNEIPRIRKINLAIADLSSSVFFPTFRRIEGGFSLTSSIVGDGEHSAPWDMETQVADALESLSRNLSIRRHRFVCSISTADIVSLLTTRYAEVSQQTNAEHATLVSHIMAEIELRDGVTRGARSSTTKAETVELLLAARNAIEKIKELALHHRLRQEQFLRPFETLSETIEKIFRSKGIRVTDGIIFGQKNTQISSDILSAGEKQLFSFLVYNTFSANSPIFIDEPELSLHVDWQRSVIPLLLQQRSGNQFFVATHSPFIYSRYTDKEILLGESRGE